MLSLSGAVQIFLYEGPADMRKGFDGLAALIEAAFPHQFILEGVENVYWVADKCF
jgi:hypothetical protein